MKKTILILFLFIEITYGYSQNYSKNKIEKAVVELTNKVTDTVYFDYINGKELEKPILSK